MTVSWIDAQIKAQALTGSVCHKVALTTLPRFVLHFGERRSWPAPAGHDRTPKGEFGLYVFSAWRFLQKGEPIAESNGSDDHLVDALHPLDGAVVESIELKQHTGDLVVKFDGRRTLEVFCGRHDQHPTKTSPVNWSVHVHEERLRCKAGAEFVLERSRRRE